MKSTGLKVLASCHGNKCRRTFQNNTRASSKSPCAMHGLVPQLRGLTYSRAAATGLNRSSRRKCRDLCSGGWAVCTLNCSTPIAAIRPDHRMQRADGLVLPSLLPRFAPISCAPSRGWLDDTRIEGERRRQRRLGLRSRLLVGRWR